MSRKNQRADSGHSLVALHTGRSWTAPRYGEDLNGPVTIKTPGKRSRTLAAVDGKRYASPELRLKLLARDNSQCRYCGRFVSQEDAQFDHRIPWKLGGRTDFSNLVTCCPDCNKAKGNQTWKAQLQPA